jgi:DNA/RNA endonuclease YhcR with UshA esterase domain
MLYQHPVATSCWYTDSTWEPGPLTKGQVARILFYMATRYDGTSGESDLELVPHNNTFPYPEFGNLTTLLKWNNQYPPSDFERRRNERIYQIQQNRNPFVDHPEFANFIWNNQVPSGAVLEDFKMFPEKPVPGQEVLISLKLAAGSTTPASVKLYWGASFDAEDNQSAMASTQSVYTTNIKLPTYQPGEMIYFKVEVTENQIKKYIRATYLLPKPKEDLTISTIEQVQGNGTQTPFNNQIVTIAGRVTANFDGSFYIQNGVNPRNGICIYGSLQTGKVGDSLVVTGTATEYSNLTELTNISYLYNFQDNKDIAPLQIPITQINEDYEGMLVEIKGVEFENQGITIPNSNISYTFSNQNGSSVVFSKSNSRLVGNRTPSGKINIVGVVGQFQNTYQILPRDMNDFYSATNNSIQLSNRKTVDIYPNPTNSILKIRTSESIDNIRVFDLSGRLIIDEQSGKKEISVQELRPGIYILNISLQGKEVVHAKFIKSK